MNEPKGGGWTYKFALFTQLPNPHETRRHGPALEIRVLQCLCIGSGQRRTRSIQQLVLQLIQCCAAAKGAKEKCVLQRLPVASTQKRTESEVKVKRKRGQVCVCLCVCVSVCVCVCLCVWEGGGGVCV